MKKKLGVLSGVALSFAPLLALAQGVGGNAINNTRNVSCANASGGTIEWIICKIGDILNILIPILIVAGVVFFVWGVVQFVISDDEEAKKKGKNRMIFGIIGLVVIVAMWGLVGIVEKTFGLNGVNTQIQNLAPNY